MQSGPTPCDAEVFISDGPLEYDRQYDRVVYVRRET
jgi:hypothetical protein